MLNLLFAENLQKEVYSIIPILGVTSFLFTKIGKALALNCLPPKARMINIGNLNYAVN